MTALLKRLQTEPFVTLEGLWNGTRDRETMTVWFPGRSSSLPRRE